MAMPQIQSIIVRGEEGSIIVDAIEKGWPITETVPSLNCSATIQSLSNVGQISLERVSCTNRVFLSDFPADSKFVSTGLIRGMHSVHVQSLAHSPHVSHLHCYQCYIPSLCLQKSSCPREAMFFHLQDASWAFSFQFHSSILTCTKNSGTKKAPRTN